MATGLLIVDQVKGESEKVVTGYADLIDVTHYSMGVNNSSAFEGGGWSTGRAHASDFVFGLNEGVSSTQLEGLCANGTTLAKATLVLTKSIGEDNLTPYRIVEFIDCKISSYNESFAQDSEPVNMVSIAYGTKKVEYKKQETTGGELKQAASYGWDFKKNAKAA